MRILLISTCKEKLHEREFVLPYLDYLKIKGVDAEVVHYTDFNGTDCDRIIICGTGLMDNDYLKKMDRFSWLHSTEIPVMGVCSGAQIIASVFGGKVVAEKEIGLVEATGDLFGKKSFTVYALHQNGIENLDQFLILARSVSSAQAIKHTEKKIYGILFHPEVRNMWVLDGFLRS